MIKKILKAVGLVLLLVLSYVLVTLIHGTLTDYQPVEVIKLNSSKAALAQDSLQKDTISLISWNLGYAGLSAECNFFYPGQGILFSNGKMVIPEQPIVEKNMKGILNTLSENPMDFYLLQEVDSISKRSYYRPMYMEIKNALNEYTSTYAVNYQVARVPTPIFEPWKAYGQTHSGVATYSKYNWVDNTRYQLPGKFGWPDRLFLLDRCLSIQKIPTTWGKHLYLVNLHNSAFDRKGNIKAEQMAYLKEKIVPWYEAGDYVIIGGDWNQPPPYFDPYVYNKNKGIERRKPNNVSETFLPDDWKWIFDPTVPTIRSNANIYDPEKTPTGLIDYFLISPNVNALKVRGINLDFEYSDHQPVMVELALKK